MTLYSDASTVVRTGQGDSNRFDVKGVACQSSVFSPLLFAIVIDIVTQRREDQMDTLCVWDIYRMTWTMATCHKERKKYEIRMISWMGCARKPLQNLEGWTRGLVNMSLEKRGYLSTGL